jgi:hypothetical protein
MADVDTPNTPGGFLVNGAKLVGEVVLPGVSLAVDGDVKHGAAHAAAAVAAGAILGPTLIPIVWAGLALNSYSKSVTGRNFHEHFWTKKAAD